MLIYRGEWLTAQIANILKIETLQQFYLLMQQTRDERVGIVSTLLSGQKPEGFAIGKLRESLENLQNIPSQDGLYRVKLDGAKFIQLDLGYEIDELEKDIYFLEQGEKKFNAWLQQKHPLMDEEVKKALKQLQGISFTHFISDRDGTVNNYCGRYRSSVQSIYNAVYLTRFARSIQGKAILLTSAPLKNPGLLDVSVCPQDAFVNAASKGREYVNTDASYHQFPILPEKQEKLEQLNRRLQDLLDQPQYQVFSLIGSGLQFKFGQTTVARQDIHRSIPESESDDFSRVVRNLVAGLDPQGKNFRIEDTNMDLELILTIPDSNAKAGECKDFDKGDGVQFLDDSLALKLETGNHLVAGDTPGDLPMVRKVLSKNKESLAAFVTEDAPLIAALKESCPDAVVLSRPDFLVVLLNALASQEGL